jgi:hypothetical protein
MRQVSGSSMVTFCAMEHVQHSETSNYEPLVMECPWPRMLKSPGPTQMWP